MILFLIRKSILILLITIILNKFIYILNCIFIESKKNYNIYPY
jgi:hypothetical protein